jgi:iron complex outermembrane receptor protein
MRIFTALLLLHLCSGVAAQITSDSVKLLQPVVIQAYSSERTLMEVPASVGYIRTQDLNRFNNTSLVHAVNTIPGVRMEERSPGSYRFSIRGSLLRSPFGVRNVKAYWNGLPLTDGGGNTYLNLLDFNSVGSVEVIKGPGGSLYGAGTGGVILLNTPVIHRDQLEVSSVIGSYGLKRFQLGGQLQGEKVSARIHYAHQQSDGYREQTSMRRDVLMADVIFQLGAKDALTANLFYTDLYYETPGGLTLAQYTENPKQARPPGGQNRGAVEQQAAVYNKTPYAGLNFDHEWNKYVSTRIGVLGSYTDFENPAIRNIEKRDEKNLGVRTETHYRFGKEAVKGKLTAGAEVQYFKSSIGIFGNSFGVQDTTQTEDKLTSQLSSVFLQTELHLPLNFFLTVGGSINYSSYSFERTYPSLVNESRTLDPAFSPRIALLNKFNPGISLYASLSRGFSPPGIAELYPSRGIFDKNIQAEQGTNIEAGVRGEGLKNAFSFDITVYHFRLKDALVIRREDSPGDPEYFVNAGETSQKGIEGYVLWHPIRNKSTLVSDLKLWNSYAYQRYRFENYVQAEADYSGKKLTGVSPSVNTSGLDIVFRKRVYFNFTGNYTDHTPLNDANTAFASEYFLLGTRIGYKQKISGDNTLELFTGAGNLLDKKYSLGNDLNAAAPPGRYYNAAAGINFYGGVRISFSQKI